MKRFSRGFALSAIAAGALIAAGVDFAHAKGQPSQSPAPAASGHVIVIKDFAFSPSTLTIRAGESVTWQNRDSVAHTATANDNSFDSHDLESGKSYTYTFVNVGRYGYICSVHPSMQGTIVVEAAPSP